MLKCYLVSHRCHLYQGTDTSTISAGHAMLTARRPSLVESLYSSSIATLMIISPVSVVSGPDTARNPSMREPSSDSNSTRCPGSGTRRPVLAERHLFTNRIGLEPAERLGDRDLSGQNLERLVVNSAPIPCRGLGIALRYTSKSCKKRADERTRTADLLIT